MEGVTGEGEVPEARGERVWVEETEAVLGEIEARQRGQRKEGGGLPAPEEVLREVEAAEGTEVGESGGRQPGEAVVGENKVLEGREAGERVGGEVQFAAREVEAGQKAEGAQGAFLHLRREARENSAA